MTKTNERDGLAKIIEAILPDVHISISDGLYGFASRQIASAITAAVPAEPSEVERDGDNPLKVAASALYLEALDRNEPDATGKFWRTANWLSSLAATPSQPAEPSEGVEKETYAEFQQKRGMLADKVDWAIHEYDEFMLDDAYDSQRVLDRIITCLRETRNVLRTQPAESEDRHD